MREKGEKNMERKALRLGWNIKPDMKRKIIKTLNKDIESGNFRQRHLAIKTVVHMNKQNIDLELNKTDNAKDNKVEIIIKDETGTDSEKIVPTSSGDNQQ